MTIFSNFEDQERVRVLFTHSRSVRASEEQNILVCNPHSRSVRASREQNEEQQGVWSMIVSISCHYSKLAAYAHHQHAAQVQFSQRTRIEEQITYPNRIF